MLYNIIYSSGYLPAPAAHFLSDVMLDLADKGLTVGFVLVILRVIPRRYYSY